jgi:hypothetical protein
VYAVRAQITGVNKNANRIEALATLIGLPHPIGALNVSRITKRFVITSKMSHFSGAEHTITPEGHQVVLMPQTLAEPSSIIIDFRNVPLGNLPIAYARTPSQAVEPVRLGAVIMSRDEELKVFISSRESTCDECGDNLGSKAWITLKRDKGALCLSCADLDHLVFLPAGDAALSRRARKHSTLAAIVLKWSRARKRYERQGLMVEAAALEKAEEECLADDEVRTRRKEREAIRRDQLDSEYVVRFAKRVREVFPACPSGREEVIAQHACLKYSGRVGRSASAKMMDLEAVRLAVMAHIRHSETDYDELLARGYDRGDARATVRSSVEETLKKWQGPEPN